jgi:hypothetical protein
VAQLSSKTSLRGAPAGRPRLSDQSLGYSDQQINSRMLKNNRSGGNVNRCFSARFVIVCTVSSLYLQTEVGGRNSRCDESRLKNYSGLTVYG